ncbi:helix-turn-helix domain-containing protein [Streptomyces sp. MA5143a]|uniref:helix-turn-helix domain-containing protein n=1 Tax=Streptomyces sp. MA5143a TaxID=2083010 RepID=UPI0015E66658|nr:helix-turn-helix domain-containing protein [Streptomyces sp. MA5143a]
MAETKPSGAVRPQSCIRRNATRSGVTHIREYQPDRFTIIGNHLAQHRELSLTAIGLGTHILSLPQGASADIRTLAERFPEGRDRIAFALRELEAHGYIERVRERVDGGRVVTRTYAYNAPALTRDRRAAAASAADGAGLSAALPPGAVPVGQGVSASPPGSADSVPPAASAAPVPARWGVGDAARAEDGVLAAPQSAASESVEPESSGGEHHDKAVALLVGLRRTDDRFTLSRRDVRRLTPAVIAWFDNGASATAVHHAMTADVPALVEHPAGFLAYRLRELLPPPLPPSAEVSERGVPEAQPSPSYPMVDCAGGCNRAFRQPEGTWCRDCRAERDRRTAEAEAEAVCGRAA